jgi:hypothetical protein
MKRKNRLIRSTILCFFTLTFLYSTKLSAQDKFVFSDLKCSAALGGTYSFVGYSTYATFGLNWKRHQFYLGVRNVISKSYLFYTGPIGGKLGWNYIISENPKSKSFLNIDYQNSYNRAYNPRSIFKDKLNSVHEVFFSNGLDCRLSDRLWVGEKIGVGFYHETLNNLSLGVKQKNFGFNLFFDLHIRYDF